MKAGNVIWGSALALFLVWLGLVLLGKGGFIHILLLCAIAVAVTQWLAGRREQQAREEQGDH